MPLFRYKAISLEGKVLAGVVEADSLPVAKERLRKNQIYITELSSMSTRSQELSLPPPCS